MQQKSDKERCEGANLVLLEKSTVSPLRWPKHGSFFFYFFFSILYLENLFAEMPLLPAELNRGIIVAAVVLAEAALSLPALRDTWIAMTDDSEAPPPPVITQRRNNYSSPLPPLPLSPLCPYYSIYSSSSFSSSFTFFHLHLLLLHHLLYFLYLFTTPPKAPILLLFQLVSLHFRALLFTANGQWSPWRWQQWWLT